jgi:RNA polymerase sigma-70 factor (ECF subfamily)
MTVQEYNQSVEMYADAVFRFVLKNIKNEEKAKDIIQDTFEKIWIKASTIQFKKIKSYIFTTAYHTMIDYIRKDKNTQSIEENMEWQHSHSGHYTGLSEILEQAFEYLPKTQKTVLILRDYEGYTYKEIAKIADLTEAQVKVYIFRARQFLKNYIGHIETVI